jgi:MFS family permease
MLHPQVWILAIGRFLSEVGTGFTLFYAPIFFVNQVGLSATSVGFALGCGSISGVLGRILGGIGADSPGWGRRRTLLASAAISAIASFVLASSANFATLVIGSLINGLGQGLYWPATEAVVADLTPIDHRREAFALTRLADNLGLGMGIVLAGLLVANSGSYRSLFIIDGVSFILFFVVVFVAIAETRHCQSISDINHRQITAWLRALSDRRLLVYIIVNVIFTTYISQLHSTLPIYLKNFVTVESDSKGFSESIISSLFAWHLISTIIVQLPINRILRRFSHPQALIISSVVWGLGFVFIWLTGTTTSNHLIWTASALTVFAVAITSYTPSASALVTDLAPQSQRGIYFSISSLCWAMGYFIGPSLGGFALDQSQIFLNFFWLILAVSIVIPIFFSYYLGVITKIP